MPPAAQTVGHGIPVDWWALGVLIYEMMAGMPPFFSETPYGIYQKILKGRLRFPRSFDVKASDLVTRLLTMDPTRRLGEPRRAAPAVRCCRVATCCPWQARRVPRARPLRVYESVPPLAGCLRGGAADVKAHRWFSKLDWAALEACAVEPPFVPEVRSDGDTAHFPEDYPDSDDEAGVPTPAEQAAFRAFDEF